MVLNNKMKNKLLYYFCQVLHISHKVKLSYHTKLLRLFQNCKTSCSSLKCTDTFSVLFSQNLFRVYILQLSIGSIKKQWWSIQISVIYVVEIARSIASLTKRTGEQPALSRLLSHNDRQFTIELVTNRVENYSISSPHTRRDHYCLLIKAHESSAVPTVSSLVPMKRTDYKQSTGAGPRGGGRIMIFIQ